MSYYVYVLFSLKDKKLYVGRTNNLKRRIHEHKGGKSSSTRSRLPLKLIHYEFYTHWGDAEKREKYLKGGQGRGQLKIQLHEALKELGYLFLNT